MIIKILGTDTRTNEALERAVRQAVHDLTLHATIETVTDRREIARFGVRSMPALVVAERVVVSGRVPTSAELQALLAVAPAS
ncbi:MAG TPA: thioredoxin family protein [Nocardioidaceae bacterium]|nr:thioredoxin family protein [Nocardioidaceae bacterium]